MYCADFLLLYFLLLYFRFSECAQGQTHSRDIRAYGSAGHLLESWTFEMRSPWTVEIENF